MIINNLVKSLIEKDELILKLYSISGYSVEQLCELFAAGYTLEPPKYKSLINRFDEDSVND